jgi:hypothetical protein
MLESLPLQSWNGPHDADLKMRAVSALERGAVLFFPNLPFLLSEPEKLFLDARVSTARPRIFPWIIPAARCRPVR